MTARILQLEQWLDLHLKVLDVRAINSGASFRQYFRVQTPEATYIAMDSPPEREPCIPFVQQTEYLAQANVPVPTIFAKDEEQGFLLLSDFGINHLDDILDLENVRAIYKQALNQLIKINQLEPKPVGKLHHLDSAFMKQEIAGFQEWFLEGMLEMQLDTQKQTLLQQTTNHLIEVIEHQPTVFIHRDYHSHNIMLIDHSNNIELGILDFQDAMRGPLTYDAVSLLRDCYVDWPQKIVTELALYYKHLAEKNALISEVSDETFMKWFDYTGMQRHLKATLTFARKYLRDHDKNYLHYIPRTLNYVIKTCQRHEALQEFGRWIESITNKAAIS